MNPCYKVFPILNLVQISLYFKNLFDIYFMFFDDEIR